MWVEICCPDLKGDIPPWNVNASRSVTQRKITLANVYYFKRHVQLG
jgi:hypothetical protein